MNLQTAPELEAEFRAKVGSQLRLEPEGLERFRVFTPFMFDDGDHLSIILKRSDGKWILSDEGNTFMRLTYELEEKSLGSGTRQRIIADALSLYSMEDREGELLIDLPDQSYGDALYSFVQGILRISDVTLLSRERVRSAFLEDFKSFIQESIPGRLVSFDWHDSRHDPEGMYPVDCYINGEVPPVAIFALVNDARVRDSTITLLKFESWHMDIKKIGIFEDQEDISRPVLARFSDVCDKQFSSLPSNKPRILSYLESIGIPVPRHERN